MKPNPEKLTCISILICDDVYRDEVTKKLVIVGTFNQINTFALPCKRTMEVLFTLTNGQGRYELSLAVEHEQTGEVVAELTGPFDAPSPLTISDNRVRLMDLTFAREGKHWVTLKADGEIIQQRPFFVHLAHSRPEPKQHAIDP